MAVYKSQRQKAQLKESEVRIQKSELRRNDVRVVDDYFFDKFFKIQLYIFQ